MHICLSFTNILNRFESRGLTIFLNLYDFPAEFNDMLLSAMLEVRAWALARPVSEQDAVGDALADRMEQVKRTEEEQGRFTFFGRHGIVDFNSSKPLLGFYDILLVLRHHS